MGLIVPKQSVPPIEAIGNEAGLFSKPWWLYFHDLSRLIGQPGSVTLPFTTPEEHGTVGAGNDTAAMTAALADGRTVVLASQRTYLVNPLAIPSNTRIFGLPGATIKQRTNTSSDDTPFLSATGASNIYIQGVTLDGNRANQSGTVGVDALFLNNVTNVVLINCETKNTSGNGIGGLLWKNVQIVNHIAATWGLGNDYAAIYLQDGTFSALPTGLAYNIYIAGCALNGTGSGSCIKLTATQNAPLSNVRVIGNYVKVGYPGPMPSFGTPEALGIEIWSGPAGDGGNDCSGVVVANNKIESEFAGVLSYGQTWGVSLSQVTDASVTGNVITGCGEFAIELIGSRLVCQGNQATNSGPIVIILSSIMSLQSTFIVSGNSISTRSGYQFFGGPISGIQVYCEGAANLSKVIITGNQVSVQGAQRCIWLQNNGSGDMGDVTIFGNVVSGDSTAASFGIVLSKDSSGDIKNVTVEANHIAAVETAIYPGGTNGRYLWNIFGPGITTNYGAAGDATDARVNVTGPEGVHFAPQSMQIMGRPAPIIDTSGNIFMDQTDTTSYIASVLTGIDANPNVVTWMRTNFGTAIQGGAILVNARFDGAGASPRHSKTSTGAYGRAMKVGLGAGRFGVCFDDIPNNNLGDWPLAFYAQDEIPSLSQSRGVYTASTYPLYIEQLCAIRSGSGDPEGAVTASPGWMYLRSSGQVYTKASGTGNTGWAEIASAGSGVTSLTGGNRISVSGATGAVTVSFTDPGAFSTYTPNVTPGGAMTASSVTPLGRYFQLGKIVFLSLDIAVTFGGTASNRVDFTLPVTSKSGISQNVASIAIASGFTNLEGLPNAGSLEVYSAANYTLATGYTFRCQGFYEAN